MNNLLNIKTPAESIAQARKADFNLSNQGIANLRLAYWNLTTEALVEEAIISQRRFTCLGRTLCCKYRQTHCPKRKR